MDESAGMAGEHAWLPAALTKLENAFLALGLGWKSSTPNLYGLVGFGRAHNSSLNGLLGHIFNFTDGTTMAPLSDFGQVASQLLADHRGKWEDGYQAIQHALKNIALRSTPNLQRIMIFVSDEDRDVTSAGQGISREFIQSLLKEKHFTLHVVVDNTFTANGMRALGINSTKWAFLENDDGEVMDVSGGQIGGGYLGTRQDYTQLALELKGTAWDINLLRRTSSLFTDGFAKVIATETSILGMNCSHCGTANGVSMCRAAQKVHCTRPKADPLWPLRIPGICVVWCTFPSQQRMKG